MAHKCTRKSVLDKRAEVVLGRPNKMIAQRRKMFVCFGKPQLQVQVLIDSVKPFTGNIPVNSALLYNYQCYNQNDEIKLNQGIYFLHHAKDSR